ncbi:hypothetical protein ILUMI_02091 [Ignelater luminosus]|uniref:Peptidase M14 domain-containing protein n=1 Tax=Ignelater luminosus TaxID=2038154 RepID=A0A8K0DE28_IGNLU|nr:hypothetical protein ILUMI_02091 [Ignelater luminosus]
MNMSWLISLLIYPLILITNTEKVSYKGYNMYVISTENEEQGRKLLAVQNQNLKIHFLKQAVNSKLQGLTSVVVSPQSNAAFNAFLRKNNYDFQIITKDFESLLKSEQPRSKRFAVSPNSINFEEYHRHAKINSYLRSLAETYPNITNLLSIGTTTEGRELLGLNISYNDKVKPMILIDAGIHAREWIAPALALYIIQQLVENSNNAKLIKNVDWIVIPLLNPDGYEYTHTTNRLWRKTRSRGKYCFGADPNRNFNFHWGERGSSDDECSDIYRGSKPFSEPEIKAFRDLILRYAANIKLSISLHSFGQLILHPWTYTTNLPANIKELNRLGIHVAETLKNATKANYGVGPVSQVLYYAAGSNIDWIMAVAGINLTYVIELPPQHDNTMQFILPSRFIKDLVSKSFEGIKTFHEYIENVYV